MDTRPLLVAEIEELLRSYLQAHPHAVDTERGVCEWWLREAHGSYSVVTVRAAIERLLAAGELEKLSLPDGQYTYSSSANPGSRHP